MYRHRLNQQLQRASTHSQRETAEKSEWEIIQAIFVKMNIDRIGGGGVVVVNGGSAASLLNCLEINKLFAFVFFLHVCCC